MEQLPDSPQALIPWIDPTANPAKSAQEIKSLITDATQVEFPTVALPPDDLVELPGGIVRKDSVIKTVTVKELTGEDEEALARASQPPFNVFHFLDRLLKCGVERIGEEPPSQIDKLLKSMLIGDREYLILGIRKATYGEDIEVDNWKCPNCGTIATLTMTLDDIPVNRLANPVEESQFKVPFRKGGYALVRLATGEDQSAIYEKDGLTATQRETILLQKCIVSIMDKDGFEHPMIAAPSLALNMSVPDRHAVLNELRDRQPGPRYDEIEYNCESCGEDVMVVIGIGDLFLDFGWV